MFAISLGFINHRVVKARIIANGMIRNKYICIIFKDFQTIIFIDLCPMFTLVDNLKNIKSNLYIEEW